MSKIKKTATNPKGAGRPPKSQHGAKTVHVTARITPAAHAVIIRNWGSFQAFVDEVEQII